MSLLDDLLNRSKYPVLATAPVSKHLDLTGNQVKELYEFMGGDFDAEVTIEYFEERPTDPSSGDETAPAGLYVYCTDCPEEGAMYLAPEPMLTIERTTVG